MLLENRLESEEERAVVQPPRDSMYENIASIPGGYCTQWETLYESVLRIRLVDMEATSARVSKWHAEFDLAQLLLHVLCADIGI